MSSDPLSTQTASAAGIKVPAVRRPANTDQIHLDPANTASLREPQTEAGGDVETSPKTSTPWDGQPKVEAALRWFELGLPVIPIVAGTKRPAVTWDPWLGKLSVEAIRGHWAGHPSDDLGAILGDGLLVLDTDGPDATAALYELEQRHGVEPRIIVSTRRGEHHYFAVGNGVHARQDSHDGNLHPERIDVKTGRSMVNLPPSGVRRVKSCLLDHVSQLSEVDQDFVDAVFIHNGRPTPRPATERELPPVQVDDAHLAKTEALLNDISPDCGYGDWMQVLMAIFHESQGSAAGLALADSWSAKGETYRGSQAVEEKWRSFSLDIANPVTIGTLIKRAREAGADIDVLMGDAFRATSEPTEIVQRDGEHEEADSAAATPLDRFAFPADGLDLLKAALVDPVFVLGAMALLGQSTFFFAGPGTGKTLTCLFLLMRSLMSGVLGKVKVYYINLDDNVRGLFEKFPLIHEHGFMLISDNYYGFSANKLIGILEQMAKDGSARNSVILLDTVKKVVNVMDKKETSRFMTAVRRFVLKGGTFIGLAHTNKHLDDSGNPVPGGTSDIKDDADCTYVIREVDGGAETNEKFVEFECKKQRGPNVARAAYAYSLDRDISYADLLLSMRELEPGHMSTTKLAAKEHSEASVIEVIRTCLAEGFDSKMKLATETGKRANVSRRHAGQVIDRHTGDDPLEHHWRFRIGGHGAHIYQLIGPPVAEPPEPTAG
jgi:hypothetical protein